MNAKLSNHWKRIETLAERAADTGLTPTEYLALKIACADVINNPQDWHADDLETCTMILEALPLPRHDNARIIDIANGAIAGPYTGGATS